MMNFGGIGLGIKSEKIFDNIEFKFKKIQVKKQFFGVVLLKSDETFYSCFVSLNELKDKYYLEKLMNLDCFNLIVFNHSEENKIYRILNDLKNKVLFYLPNPVYNKQENTISSNELNNQFPARILWNN